MPPPDPPPSSGPSRSSSSADSRPSPPARLRSLHPDTSASTDQLIFSDPPAGPLSTPAASGDRGSTSGSESASSVRTVDTAVFIPSSVSYGPIRAGARNPDDTSHHNGTSPLPAATSSGRRQSFLSGIAESWRARRLSTDQNAGSRPQPISNRPNVPPDHWRATLIPGSVSSKTPARTFVHGLGTTPGSEPQFGNHDVRRQTEQLASWLMSDAASQIPQERDNPNGSGSDPNSPPNEPAPESRARLCPEQRQSAIHREDPDDALSLVSSLTSQEGGRYGTFPGGQHADQPASDRFRRMSALSNITTPSFTFSSNDDIEGLGLLSGTRELSPQRAHGHSSWCDGAFQSIRRYFRDTFDRDPKLLAQSCAYGFARSLPAVFLGWLLNVLDALSYGMILFPLGIPIFAETAPDGLSIFFLSCIVSQLVFSFGASGFKGGVGSEMIEVVPFFHKMVAIIMATMGPSAAPSAVLATVITSYALSSIMTGAIFFGLGVARLGSVVSFFPRSILTGCIGGVGIFLLLTGVQVSSRLEGVPVLDLAPRLFDLPIFILWTLPLLLAIVLSVLKQVRDHEAILPSFFIGIVILFYLYLAISPSASLDSARETGWVFEKPGGNVPFWRFYTYFKFEQVDWSAILKTVPSMLALSFFGILHVPINVPALAIAVGEDDMDVNRELIAHGISNSLSGFFGSIQNYLVYANSAIFVQNGGNSRLAGLLLAIATAATWVAGPGLIGYIPVMVVGALIYYLGIELTKEALWDSCGRSDPLEYSMIVMIALIMGFYDFVSGIVFGIILACFIFVLQNSRVSVVRADYSGVVAESTVRRHPIHRHFLRRVGTQIHVLKLAGYLFFGSIVEVEDQTRKLVDNDFLSLHPIRFLVLDFHHVTGIDFSAAEALCRIDRVLRRKQVELVLSSISPGTAIERSLTMVGLFNHVDGRAPRAFEDLNYALEYCENGLLTVLREQVEERHKQQDQKRTEVLPPSTGGGKAIVPGRPLPPLLAGAEAGTTPRRTILHRAATMTIAEADNRADAFLGTSSPRRSRRPPTAAAAAAMAAQRPGPGARPGGARAPPQEEPLGRHEKQPIPVLRQILLEVGPQSTSPSVWRAVAAHFEPLTLSAGEVLFGHGERAGAFYIVESGSLRADYVLEHTRAYAHTPAALPGPAGPTAFSEQIVAGTTCGELPFFGSARRSATVTADAPEVRVWALSRASWDRIRAEDELAACEVLRLAMRLSAERMANITRYALILGG